MKMINCHPSLINRFILVVFAACTAVATAQFAAASITPENVLVLYDADDGSSGPGQQIANHYQQVRNGVHVAGINGLSSLSPGQYQGSPNAETISGADYLSVLRPQVLSHIESIEAATGTSIDVVVTTKGMPLRIDAGPSPNNSSTWKRYSSLESELTRIDSIDTNDKLGNQFFFIGLPQFDNTLPSNPYYQFAGTPQPFSSNEGIRLSSRLDGYSVQSVTNAIDRAQTAYLVPFGQYIVADDTGFDTFDQITDTPQGPGDGLVEVIEGRYPDSGSGATSETPLLFNQTNGAVRTTNRPVIGYVSHGTNDGPLFGLDDNYLGEFVDGQFQPREINFQLANGAIFHTHESFNAESFEPTHSQNQGLIADWLELGGTAGLGHVAEPSNGPDNVTNEDLFYEMLLPASGANAQPGEAGLTLVEAAWGATRQLSYVNTVVGDPLMRIQAWLPGDFNLDGSVNLFDLIILQDNWLQQGAFAEGDANNDGNVNLFDLIILQDNWLDSILGQPLVGQPGATGTPRLSDSTGDPIFVPIPEPSSLGILVLAAFLGAIRCRHPH